MEVDGSRDMDPAEADRVLREEAQARRRALLSWLFDLHLRSMKAVPQVAAATAGVQALAAEAGPATAAAALPEPDECDEQVQSSGAATGASSRAKAGARRYWRGSPGAHRSAGDCSSPIATAVRRLSTRRRAWPEAFRSGRATLAIEAVPLFERAMTRLVASRSQSAEAGAA